MAVANHNTVSSCACAIPLIRSYNNSQKLINCHSRHYFYHAPSTAGDGIVYGRLCLQLCFVARLRRNGCSNRRETFRIDMQQYWGHAYSWYWDVACILVQNPRSWDTKCGEVILSSDIWRMWINQWKSAAGAKFVVHCTTSCLISSRRHRAIDDALRRHIRA